MPPRKSRLSRPSPTKPQKLSPLPRSRASSSSERSSSPDPLDVISDKGSISGRRSSSVYIGSVKHQRQKVSRNSNDSQYSESSSNSSSTSDSRRSLNEEHQSGTLDVESDTSDQEERTSLKNKAYPGEDSEDEWSSFRDTHDKGKKQNTGASSRKRQASDTRSISQVSQYSSSTSDHLLLPSLVGYSYKPLMADDHAMDGGEVKAEGEEVRASEVERESGAEDPITEHGMDQGEGKEAYVTRQDAKIADVSGEQGGDEGREAENPIPVNGAAADITSPSNTAPHESSPDPQQAPVTTVSGLSAAGNDIVNEATAQTEATSTSHSEENVSMPVSSSSLSEEHASKGGVTDVHPPEVGSEGIEAQREPEQEAISVHDTLQAGITIPLPSSSLSEYDMSREGARNAHLPGTDVDVDFTRTDTADPTDIPQDTTSAPIPGPAQTAIEDQAMAFNDTPSTATNGPVHLLPSFSEPPKPAQIPMEDHEMAVDNGQEKQVAEVQVSITADLEEEEGEEELDLDTAPSPEAESEAEVGNENTDIEMDGSSVVTDHVDLGSSKAEPEPKIRKKPGPKPKGTNKKVEAAAKKATKGAKGKPKVDELKGSSKNKNRSTPDSTIPSPSKASNELTRQESPDPASDRTYCVCRKKESEDDEDVLMVGCESCDDWFHAACVGLSEDQVKNLDVYICRSCERSTKQKTIYKKTCKRDTCDRGLGDRESKFCSDLCAYKHFKAFTDSMTNKKTLKAIATSFSSYPKPVSVEIIHHIDSGTQVAPEVKADDHTQQMIAAVQAQITATTASLEIVRRRQQILQMAIDNAEGLAPIIVQPEERSGKGRRKGGGGPTEDKQCGWDPKLLWDDEEVSKWTENQEEQGDEQHCGLAKRRCDKHSGWQKTAAFSLEVEEVQLMKKSDELASQQDMLTKSVEANAESEKARSAFRERLVAKRKA